MLDTLRNLQRHRGLLSTLTARELKARYRGSVLGFLWSLVNPLMLLGVYSFVFGFLLRSRAADTEPYGVFLICGLFPWIWASNSLLEGVVSLSTNGGLIKKAVFPFELLPVVSVLSNLVHFLFALPIMALALVAARLLGFPVSGWTVVLLPLIVAIQLVMVTGMALGLSALNVHFKDVRDLLTNLLTLLFFLAPIIYPITMIPERFRPALFLNPFTSYAIAYQDVLFRSRLPEPMVWLHMVVMALLGFLVGNWLFVRLRETIAEAV
jgi:ABC-type polysaccharide/polyol phosphate export permease